LPHHPWCRDLRCGPARLRWRRARPDGRVSWLQITCPVALVDRNLASAPPETREAAEAFARHLFTPAAQREFTACGFRSAVREVAAESGRAEVRVWPSSDSPSGVVQPVRSRPLNSGVNPGSG
jgi:hypothetical protein